MDQTSNDCTGSQRTSTVTVLGHIKSDISLHSFTLNYYVSTVVGQIQGASTKKMQGHLAKGVEPGSASLAATQGTTRLCVVYSVYLAIVVTEDEILPLCRFRFPFFWHHESLLTLKPVLLDPIPSCQWYLNQHAPGKLLVFGFTFLS